MGLIEFMKRRKIQIAKRLIFGKLDDSKYRLYFFFIILFPLIWGVLNNRFHIVFGELTPGDILSYYAVTLGIGGSIVLYRIEQDDKSERRTRELAPILSLYVERISGGYRFSIINDSIRSIYYAYIEDVFLATRITPNETISFISGEDLIGCCEKGEKVVDIYLGQTRIDLVDGMPKDFNIYCEDTDNNVWCIIFKKIREGDISYYHLEEAYLA